MSRDPRQNQSSDNEFAGLTGFESALSALAPRAAEIDPSAFYFQAGRTAALSEKTARRQRFARWGWPLAFGGMTAAAAALLVALLAAPKAAVGPSRIAVDTIVAPQTVAQPGTPREDASARDFAAYAQLREQVLALGVEASLPRSGVVASSSVAPDAQKTYREMLRSALQEM